MSDKKLIRRLSLSRIGDLLRDKLGSNASSYKFPDQFEQAVADIDFKAVIYEGENAPYDVIVVGRVDLPFLLVTSWNGGQNQRIKSLTFVGTGTEDYAPPNGFIKNESLLTSVALSSNVVSLPNTFCRYASLNTITGLSNVTVLGTSCFDYMSGNLEELNFSSVTTITGDGLLDNSTNIKRVYLPKWTIQARHCMRNCTGLTYVQIGSQGYPAPSPATNLFNGCTQEGLIIDYWVDTSAKTTTALTNLRNKATNATINIKAAIAFTYDGTSYSAGDTVVTSTPS